MDTIDRKITELDKQINRGQQEVDRLKGNGEDSGIVPEPLRRPHPPAIPFPMDALGSIGKDAAERIQSVVRAPDAICGQSILGGLALAAQARANVSIDGRVRPVSLFLATVGETGERKTGVDDIALMPHRTFEREQMEKYRVALAEYEDECIAWKMDKDERLKKARGGTAKKQVLVEAGPGPAKPINPAMLAEEPTYEGLIRMLANDNPTIGLFTDEGGRFVGGYALNSENALKTAAGLSSLWDRGEARRTRGGEGHSILYGKRVSLHMMLQGVVAEKILSERLFREQGWLSRMLIAWPTSTVGNRPYQATNIYQDPAVMRYAETVTNLLGLPPPLREDSRNELAPMALTFSDKVKALWVKFHDFCDKEAGARGELEQIRGLANKMPEHVARMAAVLTVAHQASDSEIPPEYMEAGITLGNFYLEEALRIESMGAVDPEVMKAERLLEWLYGLDRDHVYLAQIYQIGPGQLRSKKAALQTVRTLEDHRWLIPIQDGMEIDGRHRKQVWRIIK